MLVFVLLPMYTMLVGRNGSLTSWIFKPRPCMCEQKAQKPQTAGPFTLGRLYHCWGGQPSFCFKNLPLFPVCGALPTKVEWGSYLYILYNKATR